MNKKAVSHIHYKSFIKHSNKESNYGKIEIEIQIQRKRIYKRDAES